MAEHSAKTKGRAGPKITVPKGLDEVAFSCRVPKGGIDFPRMTKELAKIPSFDVSPRGVIHGSAMNDSHLSGHHAHFTADQDDDGRVFITYSLHANPSRKRSSEKMKEAVPTVSELPELIGQFVTTPEQRLGGVVSGNFVLDRKEWQSTIPLPFDVPGPFGQSVGAPQIAGVDFNFRDTKQQPISRAFVSTYTDEIVVRILSHFSASFGKTLNQEIIDEAGKHLPIFVQPAKGSAGGD